MKWKVSKVGSLCDLKNGKAYNADDWAETGLPIIRIQNLNDKSKPFNYWPGTLDRQVHVRSGDLLLAWSGTPGTSFGAHIWNGPEGVLNQHIFRIDLTGKEIEKRWFQFCLNQSLNELIHRAHGGVGLKHVTKGAVDNIEIPLPPLAEQKRIAGILDAADMLRAKRRESLTQHDSLLQSTFLDLFGDPVSNPMGWETTTLDSFSLKVTDGDHHTPERTDSGIKLLSARNVLDGEIDLSNTDFVGLAEYERMIKRCHPERGDVLISCSGSIGRVSQIKFDEPVVLVRSAALVKIDHTRAISEFVEHLLRTPALNSAMQRAARSVAQANLFQKPIKNLPVFVPPLPLQRRFAAIVESVERQKARQRAHLAELDSLFAALQHRAFRGEL